MLRLGTRPAALVRALVTRTGPLLAALAIAAGCAYGLSEDEGEVAGADASPRSDEPDPAPGDPEPDPPGDCEPAWVQLLGNGSFDDEPVIWQGSASVIKIYEPQIISAHSGTRAAWFAGFNNANQALTQQVTVPAAATTLRFEGFRCFVSDAPGGTGDSLEIRLVSGQGELLEILASYTNQDAGAICDWEPLSLSAAATHAGQPITLELRAQNDATAPTAFHLDTLRLEALTCP